MYLEGIAHPWQGALTGKMPDDGASGLHPALEAFEARLNLSAPAAAPTMVPQRYEVKQGDNLSRIVRQQLEALGEKPSNQTVYEGVRKVARENGIKNPDVIHPGQNLDLRILGGATISAAPVAKKAEIPTQAPPAPPPRASAPAPKPAPEPTERREARAVGLPPKAAPVPVESRAEGGPVFRATAPLNSRARFEAPGAVEPTDLGLLIHDILEGPPPGAPRTEHGGLDSPWARFLGAPARLTSDYGLRPDPFTGRLAFHDGIDLAAPRGTAIYPYRDGVVSFSGWKGGYGRVVVIDHEDGYSSLYAHNARNHVQQGQRIGKGEKLGEIGSTGRSTGPHLHFEIRKNGVPVNPIPYLEASAATRTAHR